ncbi:putative F-box protein At4g17565 [Tripterygium wilfordii]|uniref:putative F-box protein At4g17565 n=1 Tax=Tripterygium wilfordii TaxID=458696 RepID=UPI0018F83A20|nr:putative F-box protein At4g17565 [Tripterygium wilfordii]
MARPPYYKKRKTSQPEWANLNGDLLQNIFNKLSFVDVCRTKPVCSRWNKNAQEIFKTRGEVPWLLFPPQEDDYYLGKGDKTARLLNLQEKRFYNSFNNEATEKIMSCCNCCCVGSSHGWLIFLDEYAVPFLLNPFSSKRIQLPHLDCCLSLATLTTFCNPNNVTSVWRERFVNKAILSSYPSNLNDCYVALIYGRESRLAFCRINGDRSWTELDGKHEPYEDIIIRNKTQLCALAHDGSLEVWDMVQGCISTPAKKMDISSVEIRRREDSRWRSVKYLQTLRYYLVESSGDLLLVIRYVGEIVNTEGEAVSESYLLGGESNHPLVFPYKTLHFEVFRLDNDHKMWVQVDSLGDNVLFLGGSESISIPVEDCLEDMTWASLVCKMGA